MSDEKDEKAPKKRGKLVKILAMVVGVLVLLGGGVGAGLYASSSGLIGGGHGKEGEHEEVKKDLPKLVPKSEGKFDLEGLITRTYPLEGINQGYEDMRNGKNIRGVLVYEH